MYALEMHVTHGSELLPQNMVCFCPMPRFYVFILQINYISSHSTKHDGGDNIDAIGGGGDDENNDNDSFIQSCCSLSYDRSTASSKASSPQSAIWCLLF
jgi:hypothetical protein